MPEWLVVVTEYSIILINAMALLVIVGGTIEAFARGIGFLFSGRDSHLRRDVWLRFARCLVVGLSFQLAADIIETSITTRWEAVARLGVTAVIRTFLNYFLEKDLTETRELQRESEARIRDAKV